MHWRFSANSTHLYPGAFLRCRETPGEAALSSGDDVAVEFSDGVVVPGRLASVKAEAAELRMPGYRTGSGTDVTGRRWRLVPAGEPGLIRVQARVPDRA